MDGGMSGAVIVQNHGRPSGACGAPHLDLNELGIRSLIPGFWVELDTPKRLGGNQKRLACPVLNFTPNKIMQAPRNVRRLALLNLGYVFPSEATGRIV